MKASNLELYAQVADVEVVTSGRESALASINRHHHPVGAIGAPTGGVAAIRAAERWLRERGCTHARGPLEVATWFTYRANVSGSAPDRGVFLGEPVAPSQPWIDAGYQEVARYASWVVANEEAIAAAPHTLPEGFELRPMTSFEQAVETIHRISHRAFAHAYAFSPLSLEHLAALYRPLQPVIDPRLVLFVEHRGEPVAFVLGMPDALSPGSCRFIVKSLAVDPAYQREGLGTWLVAQVHAVAQGLGFREGVHALMWSGSASRKVSRKLSGNAGRLLREYALYERALT